VDGSVKNVEHRMKLRNNYSTLKNLETGPDQVDDPRNDEDYDTFDYGTEPIPGDTTWIKPCHTSEALPK